MDRIRPALPILAAIGGVACLSLMDAFMKGAALAVGAFSAAWLRAVLGTAIAAPLWLWRVRRRPGAAALRLHVERGVVSTFMALSFFYALTKLPIAETIAISFVAPLITLYLARLFLGEQIRRSAVVGSIMGFCGTLVIIGGKVGRGNFDADTGLGLAAILFSACLYAYNFIVIRKQSQAAGPEEIALFHSGVSALILGVAAPFLLTMPDAAIMGDLAIAALLTVLGALAIAWAYAREEAQVLVPMEYTGFLWAALFGWLFFREAVSITSVAGTACIVAGCWIAVRGPRAAKPEQAAI